MMGTAHPTNVARRNTERRVEASSQGSYLDVVCNIVGIVMVLVILIAVQAKRGVIATATVNTKAATAAKSAAEIEAQSAEEATKSLEFSMQELELKIYQEKLSAAAQDEERQRFQILVDVIEQRLAEHRDQLSAVEQARYDLEQELVKSKGELASLQTTPVSFTKPKPHVLEHLPTPMARTVFGTEVHFRLLNHRLAYVPFDEMAAAFRVDANRQMYKLKDTPRAEFSLPEVAGFGARYILRRFEGDVETRAGTQKHSGVELELIYFVDVEPNLGEPMAQALAPSSEFRGRIAACRPQSTTVTVWVYPDSFDDFRALKAELFRLGFLTAARPTMMGEPIAGSPSGHRSSAE
jgi:hypothetical protein